MKSGKVYSGRPIHLVFSAGLMVFAEAGAITSAVLRWQSLSHPALGIALSVSLATLLLWFYWQGSNIARWIVIIGGILDLITALTELLGVPAAWVSSEPHPTAVKIKYVVQICVCAYIVGWLFTKQAQTYFSPEERHRRELLTN
jgi:hypothetical protein